MLEHIIFSTALTLSDGPSITVSFIELGIVSALVGVLFTVLKWSTNRFLLKTVDSLVDAVKTINEKVNNIEKEMITGEAHANASFLTKDENTKMIMEVNRRLDKHSEVCERLQIAVAELALLIKETRDEYKEIMRRE